MASCHDLLMAGFLGYAWKSSQSLAGLSFQAFSLSEINTSEVLWLEREKKEKALR